MKFLQRRIRSRTSCSPPPMQRPPPKLAYILKHRDKYRDYYPSKYPDDTSLATLYRIYVAVAAGLTTHLRNEIEYFWRQHTWSVAAIPEPSNNEAECKAILAASTYLLVKAFNRLIGMGLPRDTPPVVAGDEWDKLKARPKIFENVPAWAENMQPLKKVLVIPDANGEILKSESDEDADQDMLKKNILITVLPVLFT